MAITSFPWDGISSGHSGPYTADAASLILEGLINSYFANREGIIPWGDLWAPTFGSNNVSVGSGMASVKGRIVRSDSAVNISLPRPTTAARIDLIVLRISWATKLASVTRIAGAEGGSAPAPVQVYGTTWDLPLYSVRVPVSGSIVVHNDLRRYGRGLVPLNMRIGASPTEWNSAVGTGNQPTQFPVYPYVQGGVESFNSLYLTVNEANTTIVFPEPFDYSPFVLVTPECTDPFDVGACVVVANIVTVTSTEVTIHFKNIAGYEYDFFVFHWLAIGQKRSA